MNEDFGWDYPPGVTTRMIDEQVGPEDRGVEVWLSERKMEYFLVKSADHRIVIEHYQYRRGEEDLLLDAFELKRAEAQLLAHAISERT